MNDRPRDLAKKLFLFNVLDYFVDWFVDSREESVDLAGTQWCKDNRPGNRLESRDA